MAGHRMGTTSETPVGPFPGLQRGPRYAWRAGPALSLFCTRKEIIAEIAQSPSAPHGPEGPVYPGTCRDLSPDAVQKKKDLGSAFAMRLNLEKAITYLKEQGDWPLTWQEDGTAPVNVDPQPLGDVVLARKDTPTSYHLAVSVDDALQGITHVIRGEDLFHATHIHRLLQALLGLPVPHYRHHPLIMDAEGKRLAKRDKAATIRSLRERGDSPQALIARLANRGK